MSYPYSHIPLFTSLVILLQSNGLRHHFPPTPPLCMQSFPSHASSLFNRLWRYGSSLGFQRRLVRNPFYPTSPPRFFSDLWTSRKFSFSSVDSLHCLVLCAYFLPIWVSSHNQSVIISRYVSSADVNSIVPDSELVSPTKFSVFLHRFGLLKLLLRSL